MHNNLRFLIFLSENPIKDQITHFKTSDDYLTNWTISDYLYQYFGLKITNTMTCLYSHDNKSPKKLEYDNFIMSLGGIPLNNK